MSMTSKVTDPLASLEKLFSIFHDEIILKSEYMEAGFVMLDAFNIVLREILNLRQDVQSLSTQITSATSDSGTETEDSQSPTGEHGG